MEMDSPAGFTKESSAGTGSLIGPDWPAIRADYEQSGEPQRVVAERYDVSESALKYHIQKEGWARRYRPMPVDRPLIIRRMFRVLEKQVKNLEAEMNEMTSDKRRTGEKEAVLLGRLAGSLDKLMRLDRQAATDGKSPKQPSKQMQELRNKLAQRIEQLSRD